MKPLFLFGRIVLSIGKIESLHPTVWPLQVARKHAKEVDQAVKTEKPHLTGYYLKQARIKHATFMFEKYGWVYATHFGVQSVRKWVELMWEGGGTGPLNTKFPGSYPARTTQQELSKLSTEQLEETWESLQKVPASKLVLEVGPFLDTPTQAHFMRAVYLELLRRRQQGEAIEVPGPSPESSERSNPPDT